MVFAVFVSADGEFGRERSPNDTEVNANWVTVVFFANSRPSYRTTLIDRFSMSLRRPCCLRAFHGECVISRRGRYRPLVIRLLIAMSDREDGGYRVSRRRSPRHGNLASDCTDDDDSNKGGRRSSSLSPAHRGRH